MLIEPADAEVEPRDRIVRTKFRDADEVACGVGETTKPPDGAGRFA